MPAPAAQARLDHFLCIEFPGLLDGGQLQLFLGAEVGEQPALAHGQLGGQPADAETVQAVYRGQVRGGPENRGPGPGAVAGCSWWHKHIV